MMEIGGNLGLQMIKPLMQENEIFIANVRRFPRSKEPVTSLSQFEVFGVDIPTLEQEFKQLLDSGLYKEVRIIETAFSFNGTKLPDYVALVGVFK